jgi:hypothetical protein
MMDPGQYIFLFCLVAFIVIGINAFLYVSLKQKSTVNQVDLLRKAAERARDPWGEENANLAELSNRIAELREQGLLNEQVTRKIESLAENLSSENSIQVEKDLDALLDALSSEDSEASTS